MNAWLGRCNEFYVKLEGAMATALGFFQFTDEELHAASTIREDTTSAKWHNSQYYII